MAKGQIVGRTRTNQPVEMTDEFFAGVRGVADYAIEHGENLDASFKTVETTGNASLGGALAVTGNASVGGNLSVTGSINGEANPSVKPIYCHPIRLLVPTKASILVLIFNNIATPYTKSTVGTMLKNLLDLDANIMCVGDYIISGNIFTPTFLHKEGSTYEINMHDATTGRNEDLDDVLTDENLVVDDGVNKIN